MLIKSYVLDVEPPRDSTDTPKFKILENTLVTSCVRPYTAFAT